MKKENLSQIITNRLKTYQQETLESVNTTSLHYDLQEQFKEKVNAFYAKDLALFKAAQETVIKEWGFDAFSNMPVFSEDFLKSLKLKNKISQESFDLFLPQVQKNNKNAATDLYDLIETSQINDIVNYYFNIFDLKRRGAIAELIEKMKEIERMTKGLKTFQNIFGNFWDLSVRDLEKIDITFIKRMNDLLAKRDFIQKIAELLGRLASSLTTFEEKVIKEMVIFPSSKKTYISPANTTGVKFGNDLPIVLPHQLAMRRNETLNKIFKFQFVEKKLLELEQKEKIMEEKEVSKTIQTEKPENKGPFILCVDTSGSMRGEPEIIAKAMTMAITRIANKDERKVFVINFSSGISEYEVSDLGRNFDKFYNFLSGSFHGGTDVIPAIGSAIKKAKEKNYHNADVIMISDFIINSLPQELTSAVQSLKEKKVRFHALSIGASQITKNMNFFDNNWVYDGSEKSINKIIDDLNHLSDKENNK